MNQKNFQGVFHFPCSFFLPEKLLSCPCPSFLLLSVLLVHQTTFIYLPLPSAFSPSLPLTAFSGKLHGEGANMVVNLQQFVGHLTFLCIPLPILPLQPLYPHILLLSSLFSIH